MTPEKIKEIISEKIKELKKLGKKINDGFDHDTIHKFRVAVKSLRSFLRLLRMSSEDQKPKLSGKFKRLYHIAGAIRDAQLELDKLSQENTTLPVYTDKLHKDIKRQKAEWERRYDEKVFRKMKKRLVDDDYETLSPDALAAFYHAKVTGMQKMSNARPATSAHVHNIRKHAKDILYVTTLAKKEWKPAYKKTKDIPVNQLDELATSIGDYNDERIHVEHLMSFSSPTMEFDEKNMIADICKKEGAKLKTEKKHILDMVKGMGTT